MSINRTLNNGGLIPDDVKRIVWIRDNGCCRQCGNALTPSVDVHYDHIFPWSKGGTSDKDNVQLLCQPCNSSKGGKAPLGIAAQRRLTEKINELTTASHLLADARTAMDTATKKAQTAVHNAAQAGIPETRIAALLGVDRLTVRRWLGK
jgi:hypothetical protein